MPLLVSDLRLRPAMDHRSVWLLPRQYSDHYCHRSATSFTSHYQRLRGECKTFLVISCIASPNLKMHENCDTCHKDVNNVACFPF